MKIYVYILAMSLTTYLIRALPLLFFKKPIKSRFVRSFLHYVPVACLTAMTFPAILYTTDHLISGAVGLALAVALALKKKSLITVSAAACLGVFLTEQLIKLIA